MKNKNLLKTIVVVMIFVITFGSATKAYALVDGTYTCAFENEKKLVASNNKYKLTTPKITTVTRKPLTQKMKEKFLEEVTYSGNGVKLNVYTCFYYADMSVGRTTDQTANNNVDLADYIKLTWNKVSGATGYQIKMRRYLNGEAITANQVSDKNGTIKLVPYPYYPYVKSTTKTTLTIKQTQDDPALIGQNETMKIWIRAYKTVGGKRYYGNWSDATTVKPNKHLPNVFLETMTKGTDITTLEVRPSGIYTYQAGKWDPTTTVYLGVTPLEKNKWCYTQDGYQLQYSNSKDFSDCETINLEDDRSFQEYDEWVTGLMLDGYSFPGFNEYIEFMVLDKPNWQPVKFEFPAEYKYFRIRTYKVIDEKTQYGTWTSGKVKEIK